MMSLKLWYDIRSRFYASLGFLALIAVLHVAVFPFLKVLLGEWANGVPVLDSPEFRRLTADYSYYTASHWFGEIGRSVLFGILLTLGGILAEGRSRAALITLSLPVSRRSWLLGQLAAGTGALFLLNLAGSLIVAAGGMILGQPISAAQAAMGTLLLSVASLPYLAVTLLAGAYTGERLLAGTAAIAFLVLTNKLDFFRAVRPWMPEALMNSLQSHEFPWKAFLSIAILTLAALAGALREFKRTDY